MKGQLFISDVLVSLLVLTMIAGLAAWQFNQVYTRSGDIEYAKINSLAMDLSQLAVKRILANVSEDSIQPNVLDAEKWPLFVNNMSEMIKQPYAYEADIDTAALSVEGNGGCASRDNIAISRRLMYAPGETMFSTLTVKVCI